MPLLQATAAFAAFVVIALATPGFLHWLERLVAVDERTILQRYSACTQLWSPECPEYVSDWLSSFAFCRAGTALACSPGDCLAMCKASALGVPVR